MSEKRKCLEIGLLLCFACTSAAADTIADQQRVLQIEQAFAKTMADRDFEAFRFFLDDEAVFFSGDTPLEGKQSVADTWAAYFESPEAPFSWEPETVVVLSSGTLAHSSGPVYDATGIEVARFNSVWRKTVDGDWKVVFDKGAAVCRCDDEAGSEAAD